MNVHKNSIKTYHEERPRLSLRCGNILSVMMDGVERTDRQIKDLLGLPDMNNVRPRITELLDQDFLIETGVKKCEVTQKSVRLVKVKK